MESGDDKKPAENADKSRVPLENGGSDMPSHLGHQPVTVTQVAKTEIAFDDDTDGNPLGLEPVPPPPLPDRRWWLVLSTCVLLSVALLATVLLAIASAERKEAVLAAEQARLEESTSGRGKILATWLAAMTASSRRLTESGLVRLFVADISANPENVPLPRSLRDQRPYFQQLMADFARQQHLARATMVGLDGRILLSSPGPMLDVASLLEMVGHAPAGWQRLYSPIRPLDYETGATKAVIDALIPVRGVQASVSDIAKPFALLVLTLPVDDILAETLTVAPPDHETESLRLVQRTATAIEEIRIVDGEIQRTSLGENDWPLVDGMLEFGRRATADGGYVYSTGTPVAGLPWTIVHTIDTSVVMATVRRFTVTAIAFAVVVVGGLGLSFAALWWRRCNDHHRALTGLYQSLVGHLARQHRFLSAVTTSISDWLTVEAPDGRYLYVNPAFAAAAGKTRNAILANASSDLLSRPEKRSSDAGALFGLSADDGLSVVEINGRRRIVAASVSDLRDEDGHIIGIVTLTRDQTELAEQRRRRACALEQTIEALVHAVECRDRFLLGHTHRLRRHALAVGLNLGLDSNELAGLALAASLSQVGKIFIPDEILTKPGRHDPKEAEIMRGHVTHALSVLGRIDFDLPVVEIIGQMHERLDGSGYPNGLTDTDIVLPARILGAVDVFCARTAPRSYRDRLSSGKALYHLASNARRYDLKVIAALADVVAKIDEFDEPDALETTLIDAHIWQIKADICRPASHAAA